MLNVGVEEVKTLLRGIMGLSPVFVACFILFSWMSQIQASVLNFGEQKVIDGSRKFKLRIMERGTRFYEQVEINEDEQFAHFHVPPHNGLTETDELFDFKMNITIRRVKGVCYLQPLPEDMPRTTEMKTGFTEAINQPPNRRVSTISKYWVIGDKVDEAILRKGVREFCDQHPVYRLEEHLSDSVSVARERSRRQTPDDQQLEANVCKNEAMKNALNCNPDTWEWSCKFIDGTCVYYYKCDIVKTLKKGRRAMQCKMIEHRYDSFVCCNPSCPRSN